MIPDPSARFRAVRVALVAAMIYLAVVIALRWHHAPAELVVAGSRYVSASAGLPLADEPAGYDGQFYYRLAVAPFSLQPAEHGITFDIPAYRQQRIGYPLLVWLFSAGRPALVPPLLIVVNYLALVAIAGCGALLLARRGRSPWWALALVGYPGLVLSLARDCAEPVALAFLLAGLALLDRRHYLLAALALALAVLSRETALAAVLALAGTGEWERRKAPAADPVPRRVWLVPLLVFALWQLLLRLMWGQFPWGGNTHNLGVPFHGFISLASAALTLAGREQLTTMIDLLFLGGFAVMVALAARRTAAARAVTAAWALYGLMLTMLTTTVWVESWAYYRAATEFYALGMLMLIMSSSRARLPVAGLAAALWLWNVAVVLR